MASKAFKLALVQMRVTATKDENIKHACELVAKAAGQGANIVCLLECFNCPYGTKYFSDYSEPVPSGKTCVALSKAASTNNVWLIGGSIPERDESGRLFNCSTVWNPKGDFITKFRKMHLFDIDVPGKIKFQESEVLTAGDTFCVFETEYCKIGLAICYDIRFPELSRLYAMEKAQLLLFPGAFNMTTGPVHWEPLARARAVDNELFVALCSPARDERADYHAWGHSMVLTPWGDKLGEAGHEEELIVVDCDLKDVDTVRANIPVWDQRRLDMYELRKVTKGNDKNHDKNEDKNKENDKERNVPLQQKQ